MANKKIPPKIYLMRKKRHNSVNNVIDKAKSGIRSSNRARVNLNKKVAKINENMENYIRKNPKKSILIGAVIGAIISTIFGAIIKRKR